MKICELGRKGEEKRVCNFMRGRRKWTEIAFFGSYIWTQKTRLLENAHSNRVSKIAFCLQILREWKRDCWKTRLRIAFHKSRVLHKSCGNENATAGKRAFESRFLARFLHCRCRIWYAFWWKHTLEARFHAWCVFFCNFLCRKFSLQNYHWYPNHSKCIIDHSFRKFINVRTCQMIKTCILPLLDGWTTPLTQMKGLSGLITVRIF